LLSVEGGSLVEVKLLMNFLIDYCDSMEWRISEESIRTVVEWWRDEETERRRM